MVKTGLLYKDILQLRILLSLFNTELLFIQIGIVSNLYEIALENKKLTLLKIKFLITKK